jgi:hypothetical protein
MHVTHIAMSEEIQCAGFENIFVGLFIIFLSLKFTNHIYFYTIITGASELGLEY